jgi:Ca-activated chloride channel homolog
VVLIEMKIIRISTLFLTFILFTVFAQAQDEETIRIDTNLVSIGVVVRDKKGNYIKDLNKEQFQIFDNNKKQEIEIFSDKNTPVSYGIIYDLHPTTSQRTKAVLDSLKKFTSELGDQDDFFAIVFNERGSLDLGFIPSVEQVEKHLSLEERNKPNSLYDAIFTAGEKIRERDNQKKVLIVISDGKDHYSHHSFGELSRQLKSFNVQIYSILLDNQERWAFSDITLGKSRVLDLENSRLEKAAIGDLSTKSGGRTESPLLHSSQELLTIYDRISKEIAQQYSIGFYPAATNGKWHKVKIKITTKEDLKIKLTYRKGYQSVVRNK